MTIIDGNFETIIIMRLTKTWVDLGKSPSITSSLLLYQFSTFYMPYFIMNRSYITVFVGVFL